MHQLSIKNIFLYKNVSGKIRKLLCIVIIMELLVIVNYLEKNQIPLYELKYNRQQYYKPKQPHAERREGGAML